MPSEQSLNSVPENCCRANLTQRTWQISADIDAVVEAHKVLANIEKLRGLDHKAIRNQRLSRADRES